MKSQQDIERAVRDVRFQTEPETDKKIINAAALELQAAVEASNTQRPALSIWWENVAHGRTFRLAAAAIALLLLITGMEIVNGFDRSRVVWAEVADRMAEVDRFMFRMRISISDEDDARHTEDTVTAGDNDVAMTFFFSASLGFRWDVHTDGSLATSFVYPSGADSGFVISHADKSWGRIPASPEATAGSPDSPVDDPEEYIRRFLEREHTELGRSTIDGIEVEGVEVINPPTREGPDMEGIGRLWVSVDSDLPVRIELEQMADGQRVVWTLDFRWGAQVNAGAFEPNIPDDFTVIP
jgi:hypothetical protein